MHRIDGEGATSDNRFTEGNPTTGTPATVLTADWANHVQEEIIAVLVAAGISPSKASTTQLRDAIFALITGGGTAPVAEGVSIVDAGNYITGNNVEAAIQQLAAKIYAGTINANQIRRSGISLAGASHVAELSHCENWVEISHGTEAQYIVRPDADFAAPVGAAIHVLQSGVGKVLIVAGAGVTVSRPAEFNPRTLSQHASLVLVKYSANFWRLGGMLEAA